ncbi:MAG: hypothetical protein SGI73_22050 [Chloroflexota bacterium]|nr:hypothetical protein [Chloroflexota bacterium]
MLLVAPKSNSSLVQVVGKPIHKQAIQMRIRDENVLVIEFKRASWLRNFRHEITSLQADERGKDCIVFIPRCDTIFLLVYDQVQMVDGRGTPRPSTRMMFTIF